MQKIRVSAVSYLNSKPFIYGIENSPVSSEIELQLDNPAECARKLKNGQIEIGLVPVAILPELNTYRIIGNYCIGCIGAVSSVMLYSDVPLNQIRHILLDYQSRTSVALVKILAKCFWKITPVWKESQPGFETKLNEGIAAVVIGDRTFELKGNYKYEYDLGEEWFKFTGLPFVFACWVSIKKIPEDFTNKFNAALDNGIGEIPLLSRKLTRKGEFKTDVFKYLGHSISYSLDTEKRKGLDLFLRFLAEVS